MVNDFLGPGAAYVSLWAGVGAVGLGLVGCAIGCCVGSDDNRTPNDVELGQIDLTMLRRAERAIPQLKAAMKHLAEKSQNGNLDESTLVAEITKISDTLITAGMLKSEEKELFEGGLRKIVTNNLSENERRGLERKRDLVGETAPSVLEKIKNSYRGALHSLSNFGRSPAETQPRAQPAELEEVVIDNSSSSRPY